MINLYFPSDIELAVFSRFNKLRSITEDMGLVAKALSTSELLKVKHLNSFVGYNMVGKRSKGSLVVPHEYSN